MESTTADVDEFLNIQGEYQKARLRAISNMASEASVKANTCESLVKSLESRQCRAERFDSGILEQFRLLRTEFTESTENCRTELAFRKGDVEELRSLVGELRGELDKALEAIENIRIAWRKQFPNKT